MRAMTEASELAELHALVTEALEIHESAEDKQRRLRHLERDILTAELTQEQAVGLLGRLYAASHAEGMHERHR